MTDHEETIKQAKGHRRNREKVHRSNGLAMIAKKREPPFGGLRVSRRMTHPAGNGSLGNIKSKHQELTMDSRGATVAAGEPGFPVTDLTGTEKLGECCQRAVASQPLGHRARRSHAFPHAQRPGLQALASWTPFAISPTAA